MIESLILPSRKLSSADVKRAMYVMWFNIEATDREMLLFARKRCVRDSVIGEGLGCAVGPAMVPAVRLRKIRSAVADLHGAQALYSTKRWFEANPKSAHGVEAAVRMAQATLLKQEAQLISEEADAIATGRKDVLGPWA
ncbi:MAG: hypothetical protein Q9184_005067 [Pyrenodesmia sp. 2 TL-2023]